MSSADGLPLRRIPRVVFGVYSVRRLVVWGQFNRAATNGIDIPLSPVARHTAYRPSASLVMLSQHPRLGVRARPCPPCRRGPASGVGHHVLADFQVAPVAPRQDCISFSVRNSDNHWCQFSGARRPFVTIGSTIAGARAFLAAMLRHPCDGAVTRHAVSTFRPTVPTEDMPTLSYEPACTGSLRIAPSIFVSLYRSLRATLSPIEAGEPKTSPVRHSSIWVASLRIGLAAFPFLKAPR